MPTDSENASVCLFEQALGSDWQHLPKVIQDTHQVADERVLSGLAKITRGTSLLTQLVALVFRFPPAANSVSVKVSKTRGINRTWVFLIRSQRQSFG